MIYASCYSFQWDCLPDMFLEKNREMFIYLQNLLKLFVFSFTTVSWTDYVTLIFVPSCQQKWSRLVLNEENKTQIKVLRRLRNIFEKISLVTSIYLNK